MNVLCIGGPKAGEKIQLAVGQTTVRVITAKPLLASHRQVDTTYYLARFVSGTREFFALTPAGQTPEHTMQLLLEGYRP